MTDPKTSGPGDDGKPVARPGLRDKAQEVLARGSGDGRSADAPTSGERAAEKPAPTAEPTERIPPVPPAPAGGAGQAPKSAAPAASAPKAPAQDAESTRTGLPRQGASSVDEQTVTMSQLKGLRQEQKAATPPPAAPAAPDRPLFADAQRPTVKGSPTSQAPAAAGTKTAVAPATPPAGAATAAKKPQTATKSKAAAPRKARLRLIKVDPWSVMKTAFLLSLAFGVVLFVAVTMIWLVLGAAGVWDSVNEAVKNFDENTTFDITHYLGTSRVLGLTALVAVVDVVLMTALATLTAFLYNMAASLLGGVELTFAEEKH